jgi:hypothetical protein
MKKIYFLASHLFIAVLALILIARTFSFDSLFAYHPVAMTLAFVLCMSEGVMASRYIKSKERAKYIQLHLVLQGASVIFAAIGLFTIYYNKYLHGKQHLTTWHALFGTMVLVAHLTLTCVGLAMNYKRRSIIYLGGVPLYKRIASLHGTAGNITHVMAMLTLILSMYSNYAVALFSPFTLVFFKTCLVLLAIVVQTLKPTATPASTLNSSINHHQMALAFASSPASMSASAMLTAAAASTTMPSSSSPPSSLSLPSSPSNDHHHTVV